MRYWERMRRVSSGEGAYGGQQRRFPYPLQPQAHLYRTQSATVTSSAISP